MAPRHARATARGSRKPSQGNAKKVKVIVALGSDAVEQYITQSTKPSKLFDWESLSQSQDEDEEKHDNDDKVPRPDAYFETLVSKDNDSQDDGSTTQSDSSISHDVSVMDHLLVQTLFNFSAQEQLPMDLSNLYQRFVRSQGCNIQESSYQTVSKWMEAMECDGLVLVKTRRNGRKHEDTKFVVASGFKAVQRTKGSLPPPPPPVETSDYPENSANRLLEPMQI